jgi:hypothetical protein
MPKDDPMMDLDEAIAYVMRVTGKTRRQATAALFQTARRGELPATGINRLTGETEIIPPDAWPNIQ